MECYVGVDVHSKASVCVIQDGHGQVMAQGELPTTPEGFRRWHEAQRLPTGTPVALETGTVAFFVARELTGLGCAPLVVDAREVRLKAHRPTQKSDRRDAFELCDGLRRGIYRAIVHVPPRPIARLRELLSRRRHCVRLETAQVNAVKRLLCGAGLGPPQSESRHRPKRRLTRQPRRARERPNRRRRRSPWTACLHGRFKSFKRGIRPSRLPAICPARLPARRPSVSTEGSSLSRPQHPPPGAPGGGGVRALWRARAVSAARQAADNVTGPERPRRRCPWTPDRCWNRPGRC
jgi:hypothetical protein